MRLRVLLELGRVSNLPTVWSNVLAGAALAGAQARPAPLLLVALAASFFYTGGMFLNDAFDSAVDAVERPERPIPSGRASRSTVFALGFGALGLGVALLVLAPSIGSPAEPLELALAGVLLGLSVVAYDRWHKGFALSPVVMGLCRALVVVLGALAVESELEAPVFGGAAALLLYVVGLTHVARYETASRLGRAWPALFLFAPALFVLSRIDRATPGQVLAGVLFALSLYLFWTLRAIALARRGGPAIGRAVVSLIAGISLVDTALCSSERAFWLALFALLGFPLTLWFQRWVRGT